MLVPSSRVARVLVPSGRVARVLVPSGCGVTTHTQMLREEAEQISRELCSTFHYHLTHSKGDMETERWACRGMGRVKRMDLHQHTLAGQDTSPQLPVSLRNNL